MHHVEQLIRASGRHLAYIFNVMPFFKNWASRQASLLLKPLRRQFWPTARTLSLASDGCFRGAMQPYRVRTLVLPLPAPIPVRSWLDFGRRAPWHRHPIGPGLHRASHLRSVQRASGFSPPPACSSLWLAVIPTCSAEDLAGLVIRLNWRSMRQSPHPEGYDCGRISCGPFSPLPVGVAAFPHFKPLQRYNRCAARVTRTFPERYMVPV
jgi:hypothetical protein